MVREFGREILDAGGHVIRAKLAEIVFADPARLARLNAIVHPLVLGQVLTELDRLDLQADPEGVAVAEAALLIEAGYHDNLDRLIVVWCTPQTAVSRV